MYDPYAGCGEGTELDVTLVKRLAFYEVYRVECDGEAYYDVVERADGSVYQTEDERAEAVKLAWQLDREARAEKILL